MPYLILKRLNKIKIRSRAGCPNRPLYSCLVLEVNIKNLLSKIVFWLLLFRKNHGEAIATGVFNDLFLQPGNEAYLSDPPRVYLFNPKGLTFCWESTAAMPGMVVQIAGFVGHQFHRKGCVATTAFFKGMASFELGCFGRGRLFVPLSFYALVYILLCIYIKGLKEYCKENRQDKFRHRQRLPFVSKSVSTWICKGRTHVHATMSISEYVNMWKQISRPYPTLQGYE